jgi:hypothetical protein
VRPGGNVVVQAPGAVDYCPNFNRAVEYAIKDEGRIMIYRQVTLAAEPKNRIYIIYRL